MELAMASSAEERRSPKAVLTRSWPYWVIFAVLVFIVTTNARWLREDTMPPAWDAARYLVNSLDAFDGLKRLSLSVISDLYTIQHGMRPSIGFVWLTAPIYGIAGRSADVATLWTHAILLALILLSTYGIGARLFDQRVGLLAAVIVALNPEIARLSRVYWPHLGVVTVSALGVLLLLLSENLTRRRYLFLFGLVLGIGLMLRPIYPAVFLIGPTAFIFLRVWLRRPSPAHREGQQQETRLQIFRRWIVPGALLILFPVVILALPYYLVYARQMVLFAGSFQESGTFAPVKNPYSLASLAWYFSNLHHSISLPFFMLFVINMALYLLALTRKEIRDNAWILVIWICVPYLLLSIQATKEFFLLAPMYPALALITAFSLFYIFSRGLFLQLAAAVLVVALGLAVYWQTSWGDLLPKSLQDRIVAVPLRLPQQEEWPLEAILIRISEDDDIADQVAVGTVAAIPGLSEPSFVYYARLLGLDMSYIRWNDPLPTLLDTDYVIVKTGRVTPGVPRTIEQINATLLSRVIEDSDSGFYDTHVLLKSFPLPDDSQAKLYKRVKPVTGEERHAVVNAILKFDPANKQALKALAQLDPQEAAVILPPEGLPGIKETLERTILDSSNHLIQQERFPEALDLLKGALQQSPDSGLLNLALARALIQQANANPALSTDLLSEARVSLQRVESLSPDYPERLTVVALWFDASGDLDAAIGAYQKALEHDRNNADLWSLLGDAQVKADQIEEAIISYEWALGIAPNRSPVRIKLANIYQQQGQLEAAIEQIELALRSQPGDPGLMQILANLLLAVNRPAQAVEILQSLLEFTPANIPAHIALADYYLQQGNCQQALAHRTEVAKSQPSPGSLSALGDAYVECQDLEAAASMYLEAIALDSSNPRSHFALARVYANLGRNIEAREQFLLAVQTDDGRGFAERAQQWLESLSSEVD